MCAEGAWWHLAEGRRFPGVPWMWSGGPSVEEDVVRLIVIAGLMTFVVRALFAGLREPKPEK
jgi:hypothetical protein